MNHLWSKVLKSRLNVIIVIYNLEEIRMQNL